MPKDLRANLKAAMSGRAVVPLVKVQDGTKVIIRPDVSPPNIVDEILRITQDCDPLQFLMDVVNGAPLPYYAVGENDEIIVEYDYPTPAQRINTAKFLAERYMPKVAVVKHDHLHRKEKGEEDANSWEASVKRAAKASGS